MHFGTVLKAYREAAGLSQRNVWSRMKEAGADIAPNSISRWESGERMMDAATFLLYCEVVGIDFLEDFYEAGSKLDGEGMRRLHEYRDTLLRAGFIAQPKRVVLRTVPLYDQAVSAGTGQFLDSDTYTEMPLYHGEPVDTNFALTVAGDSMETLIFDHDIIFIKQQQDLLKGEIGVFDYNNESWVKKLEYRGTQPVMVSLNAAYEPIPIQKGTDFRVRGKYLGRRSIE